MRRIYADYAASAPLRPAAEAALREALAAGAGNASSAHWEGAAARARLEAAREEIAAAIGAHPLEIVFTSGATEANNLALGGVAAAAVGRPCMALPATEHSSVLMPARMLAARGHAITLLPVSADGRIDPAAVAAAAPDLLSVALVNAETGVVQDCAALAAMARTRGALVHVDAAQAAGTLAVDVTRLDVDLLTLSAHKLGGPPGAGALYVRRGTPLVPLQYGGPQERGLRPGSENVPALAGFAAAVTAAVGALPEEAARLARLGERLRRGLAAFDPDARIAGDGATGRGAEARAADAGVEPAAAGASAPRAPHIVNVTFPGLTGESLVAALDLEGIAVSAGSACAAGASEPSHVLLAMGWSRVEAASALRVSFGWASSAADVDGILAALPPILARARARAEEAAWPAHAS
jgi:cysteine desulfurase